MIILLVEDNRDVGESLSSALELRGHTVRWVTTVQEGADAINDDMFHAIILDRQLPDGDGTSLIPLVKEVGTPAVLYSGLPPLADIGIPKISKGDPFALFDWIESL